MIIGRVSLNLLLVCLKDVFFDILLRFLTIKQHSRVELLVFKCIFKKLNETIVLNEHYYTASFFCLFDDLGENFQATFLQILQLSLVICCLVVKNYLFISDSLQNDHFTLLFLNYVRVFLNDYLLPKFLKQNSKIIEGLHSATSYNGQSTFIDNFLQFFTL